MIELEEVDEHTYQIAHYAIEPLPREAVVDGNIIQLETVIDAVRKSFRKLGSRTKLTALAMPSASVITKKIKTPAGLSEEELEIQVETEAAQYIPFPLEEVNLDFQVIGPSKDAPDELDILIAAARKEKIEDRVAVAEGAGIRPVIMDVEHHALQASYSEIRKALHSKSTEDITAVIDIGATLTHIVVFQDNEIVYNREQTFGGDLLTQEIASRYDMSTEEAEHGKKYGGLPAEYSLEVLEPYQDTLVQEVMRLLQFFYSSTHYNEINHIVLAGGTSLLPGLPALISQAANIQTDLANPFQLMQSGPKIKTSQLYTDAPMLLVACGLALRKFDS
ncbi:MAG: type IV pilus assembly protein PilM [Proteobacteria bacterium]|nr:type IV pilus assembly protein PilM [Pseudomonadota bacterium]MDE3208544.1 pilus assembly protein PilM [Pseudomonadota bacterium]